MCFIFFIMEFVSVLLLILQSFVVSFAGEMFGKVKSDDSLVCELTSEMSCLT